MRSPSFIINNLTTEAPRHRKGRGRRSNRRIFFLLIHFPLSAFRFSRPVSLRLCGLLLLISPIAAQRVAVVAPEQSEQTHKYASQLSERLSVGIKVLDDDMSSAALRSVKFENAFNLTATQAKLAAEVIGCDYYLLVRSGTLRRTSFAKAEFYESFVTIFLVDGRSGRLIYWDLKSFEADSPSESERLFFASSKSVAADITGQLEKSRKNRLDTAKSSTAIIDLRDEDSSSKDFRPPMPYKRIKPEYTRKAYLYDIRATVDAAVNIDQNGAVTAVEIERWAGFGLDESVIETVRKMNWRPATRSGKTLPMRVLLRYNFTKIEKE